jgi:hypothetical protein
METWSHDKMQMQEGNLHATYWTMKRPKRKSLSSSEKNMILNV